MNKKNYIKISKVVWYKYNTFHTFFVRIQQQPAATGPNLTTTTNKRKGKTKKKEFT